MDSVFTNCIGSGNIHEQQVLLPYVLELHKLTLSEKSPQFCAQLY